MSTVEKALGLLDHFSEATPEIGLSEFKRITGYDKGTVHRYLADLRECGFLQQDSVTRAYSLGPALIRLANVREQTSPMRKVAAEIIRDLAKEIGELVHASLPQPNGMSLLYSHDGGIGGTRVALDESEVLPFHATSSGVVMLAFGSPDLKERCFAENRTQFTDHTLTVETRLEAEIMKAQGSGYVAFDQTYEAEVSSVAVPFFNQAPTAFGTLAVATPSFRMTPEKRAMIIDHLFDATLLLSKEIGGTVPDAYKQKINRIPA